MFNVRGHLRRRVHINQKAGRLNVRIERQNSRGLYFWIICLSTVSFGLFSDALWSSALRRAPYLTLSMFPLALTCYILAIAIGVWEAFGVEEVSVVAGSLRWTRTALTWTRTKDIPLADITEVNAITPWHGLDNTVEVTTGRKQQRIGGKLLHDEALELAQCLRHMAGLIR